MVKRITSILWRGFPPSVYQTLMMKIMTLLSAPFFRDNHTRNEPMYEKHTILRYAVIYWRLHWISLNNIIVALCGNRYFRTQVSSVLTEKDYLYKVFVYFLFSVRTFIWNDYDTNWLVLLAIIVKLLLERFFSANVSWWSFIGVWVTASIPSLQDSSQYSGLSQ